MNFVFDLIEFETLALSEKGCIILEYLLQKGIKKVIPSESPILANAITFGCSFQTIIFLLKAGAKKDVCGVFGKTAQEIVDSQLSPQGL